MNFFCADNLIDNLAPVSWTFNPADAVVRYLELQLHFIFVDFFCSRFRRLAGATVPLTVVLVLQPLSSPL